MAAGGREPVSGSDSRRAPSVAADGRLRVTYSLTLDTGESPEAKARGIAFEQTVELPEGRVPADLVNEVVGRVESVEAAGDGKWQTRISYSADLAGGNFSQLMNLLYGNISLLSGIRLVAVEWPADLLAAIPGPTHGVQGLRSLCGVQERRPLTCAVAKPLGLSPRQLAELAGEMARAGVDIIKDDHSLADQPAAPFRERITMCQAAVEEANRAEGTSARYFPSLGGGGRMLRERVGHLQEVGCRGAVVMPFHSGLDTVAGLAYESELALLAHPSGSGVLFGAEHGVAPEVYLGQVLRLAGCDAVIYPHAGGRFRMDESTAGAIRSNLLAELGTLRPSAPAPGGSIDPARLQGWFRLYGPDSVFVVGSSVIRAEDPRRAAEKWVATVRSAFV